MASKKKKVAKNKEQKKQAKKRKQQSKTKEKEKEKNRELASGPWCGLCGKRGNLTKTLCCGKWICDDADQYVPFSYQQNSCYRNHDRYTLCSLHHNEGHSSQSWQECEECREHFERTEMYVWCGTNDFNFQILENPPEYEPTLCDECGQVIKLGQESYTISKEKYLCGVCQPVDLPPHFFGRREDGFLDYDDDDGEDIEWEWEKEDFNWDKVKSTEECIDKATRDGFDEWDEAWGWLRCLEIVLKDMKEVELLGEVVELEGLYLDDLTVLAICQKNEKLAKVSLESIIYIKPTEAQTLWVKAYFEWKEEHSLDED